MFTKDNVLLKVLKKQGYIELVNEEVCQALINYLQTEGIYYLVEDMNNDKYSWWKVHI